MITEIMHNQIKWARGGLIEMIARQVALTLFMAVRAAGFPRIRARACDPLPEGHIMGVHMAHECLQQANSLRKVALTPCPLSPSGRRGDSFWLKWNRHRRFHFHAWERQPFAKLVREHK